MKIIAVIVLVAQMILSAFTLVSSVVDVHDLLTSNA